MAALFSSGIGLAQQTVVGRMAAIFSSNIGQAQSTVVGRKVACSNNVLLYNDRAVSWTFTYIAQIAAHFHSAIAIVQQCRAEATVVNTGNVHVHIGRAVAH